MEFLSVGTGSIPGMQQRTVDRTLADALSAADWIPAVIKEIRALKEAGLWSHSDKERSRRWHQATVLRRDMARRLAETRGTERRAAAICLAQPHFAEYAKEFELALSNLEDWTLPEVAALLTMLRERDSHYGDVGWLSRVVELAMRFGPEDRATLRDPLLPLMKAVAEGGIEADRRRRLVRRMAQIL
jgi:hypothetical protein